MIHASSSGSFKNTTAFLKKMESGRIFSNLDRYGRNGVDSLARHTPRETGETAHSWKYQVGHTRGIYAVSWLNTHTEGRVNIAVILQYGHGTGTGGYVQGIDYINPAIKPVYEKALEDVWRQVRNA